MMKFNTQRIKQAANGQWPTLLAELGGIDAILLDGGHHPCPKCGGTDRFRLIDKAKGAVLCNQCFSKNNGDGIAALQWITGGDFRTVVGSLAKRLGIESTNGNGAAENGKVASLEGQVRLLDWQSLTATGFITAKPPITSEAIQQAGGYLAKWPANGSEPHYCVAFPAHRKPDKPSGIILYRADGCDFPAVPDCKLKQRKTHCVRGSKDGWVAVGGRDKLKTAKVIWKCEGVPDALALSAILPDGHIAVTNLMGAKSAANCPLEMFNGKRVNVVADADKPGIEGAESFASKVSAFAGDVRVVRLPFPVTEDHGKDVRDWINEGGTFDELQKLADESPTVEPTVDTEVATTDKDDTRQHVEVTTNEFQVNDAVIDALVTFSPEIVPLLVRESIQVKPL
jgi:phage/plasmid primase-like uncharacterized protein